MRLLTSYYMHVNEGNEWLESLAFGPSDLSATAFTDL